MVVVFLGRCWVEIVKATALGAYGPPKKDESGCREGERTREPKNAREARFAGTLALPAATSLDYFRNTKHDIRGGVNHG